MTGSSTLRRTKPRTFRCLSHLERHGELVSKQDLMARVWPNVFVEPANLTVHMSALRRRCVTVGMGIASRRRCRRGPLAKPLLVNGDLEDHRRQPALGYECEEQASED